MHLPILVCMVDPQDRHRVYASFQVRHGRQYQFLEANLKTPLPRRLHFASSDRIGAAGLGRNEPGERGSGIRYAHPAAPLPK